MYICSCYLFLLDLELEHPYLYAHLRNGELDYISKRLLRTTYISAGSLYKDVYVRTSGLFLRDQICRDIHLQLCYSKARHFSLLVSQASAYNSPYHNIHMGNEIYLIPSTTHQFALFGLFLLNRAYQYETCSPLLWSHLIIGTRHEHSRSLSKGRCFALPPK